jgi:hypothetical protein
MSFADLFVSFRMQRIMDAATLPALVANNKESRHLLGVVNETMGFSTPRRETHGFARMQWIQPAIQPKIEFA